MQFLSGFVENFSFTDKIILMVILSQKDILFDYIMENSQDIIFVTDLNHKYINCNRAFLKHFGFHHESEVINRNVREIVSAENQNIVIENSEMSVKYREPKTFIYKEGKRILKQTSIPIVENCEITGILSVSTDITKEENLKYKLMEKICQLNTILDNEKKLKSQKEMFLATLTHDLKNPVQALLMTLKMFKDGMFGGLNKEQKEILSTAIESSDYMQKMIYSILSTYKVDNGVIELKKSFIGVNELICKCINENSALAKSRSVKIVCKNQVKDKLFADEPKLRRVIGNLLNNALFHAYKNTELTIKIIEQNDKLIFSFTNIGTPIPDKIKNHIFEKYVTGENLTGTGLGLYFSKKVIEAHDGKIYLETKDEKISFIFELPVCEKKDAVKISF